MFSRQRLRIKLDPSSPNANLDQFTTREPIAYLGRSMQLEMCLFFQDVLESIGNFATVTVAVKEIADGVVDTAGASAITKTIAAADFDTSVQESDWNEGTKQHFLVPLEDYETAWVMTGAEMPNRKYFQVVVTAKTTDTITRTVTLANFRIQIVDDGGLTGLATTVAADPNYYTADEVNALLNGLVKRISEPGGWIQLTNNLGYAVRISATPDTTTPELDVVIINP